MISVFEAKVIAVKGGETSGSLTGIRVKNALREALEELPQTDLEKIWHFLDTSHRMIILREDFSIMDEIVEYEGSGILRFHPRLEYLLEKNHGSKKLKKYRDLLSPIPKKMLEEYAEREQRAAERAKETSKRLAEANANREAEIERQRMNDPVYLTEQLSRRVEDLETALRAQSR